MFRFGIFKTALSIVLLFVSVCHAAEEKDSIRNAYGSKNAIDKVLFYEKLDLNTKRSYQDFFYTSFPGLSQDPLIQNSKKNDIRYRFALAEVYNIKGDEINAINVLKSIRNDKEYKLSDTEYMNLLVALQKSYLNLNLYSNVFQINSEIGNLRKRGAYFPLWSYNIKSQLYARLYLYEKAIRQLKSEIRDLERYVQNDPLIIPSAYNDLGFYYSLNDNIDSSFYYYKRSLQLSERYLKKSQPEAYNRLTGTVKGNMAVLYCKRNDYKTAIPLLQEDISVNSGNKDDDLGSASSRILLSECYSRLQQYDRAKTVLLDAERFLPHISQPATLVYFYKTKAELLKALKQTDQAYAYYKKAFRLNDSINKQNQSRLLGGNEILYHLEQQDDLIAQQQTAIQHKQKYILQIILSALLIITLFAFIYMINSRKKQLKIQKMNAEISAKNKVIKESLSEKETLLREIHHRVNNNLQMISGILALQQMYNTDDSIRLILQEGQARIQSIALIHKALYHSDNFARVSFESYLNELVTAIQKTYQNEAKTIHCIVDAGQIELNINTAIPLSLIINEIITNSFKHAFKNRSEGRIVIRLSKLNNHYKLSISDNGIGLPDHFDPMNLHSIGFDLIMGLTKQLDGELTWQNRNGTQINITFNEITSQS